LEIGKSLLELLYWAPGQILDMSAPELNFLIDVCSQVRFDVGAKIFVLKFSWWVQGWSPVMVLRQHDGAFILRL
jgi:hypothetical protein